jgi:hypothetical protein
MGMNFQNACRMVFVGLSDSWEAYYQAIRREWRFGQERAVQVYIVLSEAERDIYNNVMGKEEEANRMSDNLIANVAEFEREELANAESQQPYEERTVKGENYTAMLGDSVERLAEVPDNSVDLSIFSPPFMSLFVYSPTERDIGNSRDEGEFFGHFGYIIDHLLRVTKPGRNHGEVCIDKDPQVQAIRTHSKSLLFVQLRKDSSWLRPALADYILVFRKPGDNAVPIIPDISNEDWIEWARPVWYGIRETDTLNTAVAKENNDERHICPLQLGTIERCIRLWSNPGEMVLSPFMGIGSEGYEALRLGRRFTGVELKSSYFKTAIKNLEQAKFVRDQPTLFALDGVG